MRSSIVTIGVGLLALVLMLPLSGCVGEWTPEESVALTATISAYMVPTKTPDPEVTVPPTPEPTLPKPQDSATDPPTAAPTPVSVETPEPPRPDLQVGPVAGQLSPDFRLSDALGRQVILSGLRGQPVIVVFWASWCSHCDKEMSLLQSMYEKYGDQGLSVIGVSVPGLGGETVEKALAFVARKGISFPVVFDEEAQVFQAYKVSGVPNLFFIDRDGVIVTAYPGAMEAERLENQIRDLLEGG